MTNIRRQILQRLFCLCHVPPYVSVIAIQIYIGCVVLLRSYIEINKKLKSKPKRPPLTNAILHSPVKKAEGVIRARNNQECKCYFFNKYKFNYLSAMYKHIWECLTASPFFLCCCLWLNWTRAKVQYI